MAHYGRRILKIKNSKGKIEYRISGQWVGHAYGNQWGTKQQRVNASKGGKLLGISRKVFWDAKGNAGDLITPSNVGKIVFVKP